MEARKGAGCCCHDMIRERGEKESPYVADDVELNTYRPSAPKEGTSGECPDIALLWLRRAGR